MLLIIAHDIRVVAKMSMAPHIAQSIGDGSSKSMIRGDISVPNVQNRPRTRIMSPAFTSTASRKIYFALGRGVALV